MFETASGKGKGDVEKRVTAKAERTKLSWEK